MHAKAEAPSIRLAVALVAHVSDGICISTVIAVISTMLLMACQAFTFIIFLPKIASLIS